MSTDALKITTQAGETTAERYVSDQDPGNGLHIVTTWEFTPDGKSVETMRSEPVPQREFDRLLDAHGIAEEELVSSAMRDRLEQEREKSKPAHGRF